jgi:hypothetical protein
MRTILAIGMCLLLNSCNMNCSSRSYVISKAPEATIVSEAPLDLSTEPPVE